MSWNKKNRRCYFRNNQSANYLHGPLLGFDCEAA
jgi:hypothetical protein